MLPKTVESKGLGDESPWSCMENTSQEGFPSYFRPTIKVFPRSPQSLLDSNIPLGITLEPGKVQIQDPVDVSELGILRCNSCSAFHNMCCRIINNRTWTCPICNHENICVSNGPNLNDREERKSVVVDLIAPKIFNDNPDICPTYLFLIDLSKESLDLNIPRTVAQSIIANIDFINENANVALITFANYVTVYDLTRMRKTVYFEYEELDVKTKPSNFGKAKKNLITCLNEIIEFKDGPSGNCFGNAFQVAMQMLNESGGLVLSFLASSPNAGNLRIIPRSAEEIGRGIKMYLPNKNGNDDFYMKSTAKCAKSGISVTVFSFTTTNELGTIGVLPRFTSGHLYHYKATKETISSDLRRLHKDIFETLSVDYMWNAKLYYYLNPALVLDKILSNTSRLDRNQLALSCFSPKDSITLQLSLANHITQPFVVLQFALLYTDIFRRRRVRIFTFNINATSVYERLFDNIDQQALCSMIVKSGVYAMFLQDIAYGKDAIKLMATKILSKVKNNNLQLALTGAIANDLFTVDRTITYDSRIEMMLNVRRYGVIDTNLFAYPRLIDLDHKIRRLREFETSNPPLILHTPEKIVLFALTYDSLLELVKDPDEVDHTVAKENIINKDVNDIVEECYLLSGRWLPIECVVGGSNFEKYLVESRVSKKY